MSLYDLALCIDNNDNRMTFVGHIVCVPRSIICALALRARAQMMLLGPQINYMPSQKSCDCPINTPGGGGGLIFQAL